MDDPAQPAALLEHVRDLLVVIDESGTYRYANDASERILGIPAADLVGEHAPDYIHPEDREEITERFERLVATDEPTTATAEYRHRTADGEWVWLESRLSNATVPDIEGYVVSSRDVTDRKRAERHRRLTEDRLRELAANAADVLWMFDGDWNELLFVNDAYEDIWGQSVERLREDPHHFMAGIHPEDRPRVLDAMDRVAAGEATDIEYRVNPELGYRRWVWVEARPVVEDGTVTRIAGFARDITDRRRRERQLRVMDNLLRHNIRNDLNVIMGHAELARTEGGAAVAKEMATVLETADDLLDTAAKEREIIDVLFGFDDPKQIDVVALLEEVTAEIRESHPSCSITIEGANAADVVALPSLRRALVELLENAAEHADCDPTIDVEVEIDQESDAVEITLRDNAPPIPSNEYEPLIGEAEPTALNHGTGLGLWLVYLVVDLSDGEIRFRRAGDDGNVVTIDLPRPAE
ncbi:PAS domain S-box protein [Natronomonas marina]|jgi:PAS domain S-box-containing protein|uniref:PAS domain S-box protein n=1 Tax=Natronomonas marina TaxID=2961939 RepID=UPI0020C9FCA8|nr:PAS domain S-box protein [Natronomonas marina]